MRKKFAALFISGALAGGLFAINLAPAQATDPYFKLQRQINVLKTKVSQLQYDVFQCEEVARYGVTSNGTTVYDNFVVYSC